MKLGIDFYDTITIESKAFKRLTQALLAGGGEVHIISAVAEHNLKQLQKDVRKTHVPYTELHPVFFKSYGSVPKLKYEKCKELGIEFYIDDRLDVVQYLAAHGIPAFHFKSY